VPLGREGVDAASRVLARAFHDDPAWCWILPRERQRARALPWLFRIAIASTLAGGDVDTTAGAVRGAALWIPPGEGLERVNRASRRALATVPLRLRTAYGRFRDYTRWNYDVQLRAHPGPALYLSGLAVDPEHQGRGIGGALLDAAVAREPDLPIVLLTNSERNVGFYERHGFEVVLDEPMPHGLPTWAMVREPR
jgi:ribosomal protein S18 acetylase RimI-like enzyme